MHMPGGEVGAVITAMAQILAVLLASRALAVPIRALAQPLVVAEIVSGIALGPSGLGWLFPDAMAALFPPGSLEGLRHLSQLGLVLFMFCVGLELDLSLLGGGTRTIVLISHASIACPFALGVGAAWWLAPSHSLPGVQLSSFALFLGSAMSITAFPVLARILAERRLIGSRIGAVALACAAVDDVTAWCLLAFVVALVRARGELQGLWTTLLALAFVLGMLRGVRPLLRRVAPRVTNGARLRTAALLGALALLAAASGATEWIGIHALFGAFLAGAVIPREAGVAQAVAEKLRGPVVALMPLFFAYSGLRTELGLLSGSREWLTALALILLASLGKFGGGAVAARARGFSWRDANAIGILMNTRGLMELVVLNIGLDLGILSHTFFAMMVVMALATTLATTPVLRLVYPAEYACREWRLGPARPEGTAP